MVEFAIRDGKYMNWQLFLHHLWPYRLRRWVSAYISFQSKPANWAEASSIICRSHSLFLSVRNGNDRFEWIFGSALKGKRANRIFALECLSTVLNGRTNSYRFLWRHSWRRPFWCRILTNIRDMSIGRWFTFERSRGFIIQSLHIEFRIFLL